METDARMIEVRPLADAAPAAIDALLDAAFGPDRHGRTAYLLRSGTTWIPGLSFAAFRGDALVGTLQCWPLGLATADGRDDSPVLVGPVAVAPACQRDGIGRLLMTRMLNAAHGLGEGALVLIGDPEYYGRFFGFDARATAGWTLPGPYEPRRLLARLAPGRTLPATGTLGPRPDAAGPPAVPHADSTPRAC